MDDATGLAEALLGFDGFRVLRVEEMPSEVIVTVETVADFVGCPSCGVRAEAKDRVRVDIRDLPCCGREQKPPARSASSPCPSLSSPVSSVCASGR